MSRSRLAPRRAHLRAHASRSGTTSRTAPRRRWPSAGTVVPRQCRGPQAPPSTPCRTPVLSSIACPAPPRTPVRPSGPREAFKAPSRWRNAGMDTPGPSNGPPIRAPITRASCPACHAPPAPFAPPSAATTTGTAPGSRSPSATRSRLAAGNGRRPNGQSKRHRAAHRCRVAIEREAAEGAERIDCRAFKASCRGALDLHKRPSTRRPVRSVARLGCP